MPRTLAAAVAAVLGTLALAASAHAASLTFIKDHDVWIANPDGSGAVQVTTDGTAAEPYNAPAMSDQGLIAVGKDVHVHLLRQNGELIRRFTPPGSGLGGVYGLSFSPDGEQLTYGKIRLGGDGASLASGTSGVMDLEGNQLAHQGEYDGAYPFFVSDDVVLTHGGAGSFNLLWHWKEGPDAQYNWFDDWELMGSPSEDLGDGELSANLASYVALRGYGERLWIATYRVNGTDLRNLPLPTPLCLAAGSDLDSPTIDGQGTQAWWDEPDGIWTSAVSPECPDGRLLIPGASEPDWSAANVDPGPKAKPAAKRCAKLKGKRKRACLKRARD